MRSSCGSAFRTGVGDPPEPGSGSHPEPPADSHKPDEPMMVVHSYEPLAITKGAVIERPEENPYAGAGLVDRFTATNKRSTAVVERLRARMPRPSETKQLQLRPGTPVMIIARTTYSEDNAPLETADLLLDVHRFELEYALKVDLSR